MIVYYGTSPLGDNGAVGWDLSQDTEVSPTGQRLSKTKTVTLNGGFQVPSNLGYTTQQCQDWIAARTLELETILARFNQSVWLAKEDGTTSAQFLTPVGSSTGVQLVSGPNYSNERGAVHGTFVLWTATFRATYPISQEFNPNEGTPYVTFRETVSRSGGRPRFVAMEALNADPQIQMTSLRIPTTITQSGQATGYRGYPPFPNMLYPQAPAVEVDTGRTGPEQKGLELVNFGISWTYKFTFSTPPADVLPNYARSPLV
jgi:hypothetical protein